MSTSNSIEVSGPGGAPRETAAPKLLRDMDTHPRTEAPATRPLSNQKYYINSKSLGWTPSLLEICTLGSQGYSVNSSKTSSFER